MYGSPSRFQRHSLHEDGVLPQLLVWFLLSGLAVFNVVNPGSASRNLASLLDKCPPLYLAVLVHSYKMLPLLEAFPTAGQSMQSLTKLSSLAALYSNQWWQNAGDIPPALLASWELPFLVAPGVHVAGCEARWTFLRNMLALSCEMERGEVELGPGRLVYRCERKDSVVVLLGSLLHANPSILEVLDVATPRMPYSALARDAQAGLCAATLLFLQMHHTALPAMFGLGPRAAVLCKVLLSCYSVCTLQGRDHTFPSEASLIRPILRSARTRLTASIPDKYLENVKDQGIQNIFGKSRLL